MVGEGLRVAMLGAGGIARTHARCLRESGAEIAAVCARTEASAGAFVDGSAPGAKAYTDFLKMLDVERPDALYVSLPPGAHRGQVETAAQIGLPLFLEKPIALDVERAEAQVRAIEKHGVVSLVGYQMRFSDPVRRLRELIDQGEAGRATLFQGTYLCNALHAPWWRDAEVGGGQLVEQAIHLYDLAMYLGGPVDSVSGFAANLTHGNVDGYTVDDTSAALLRFRDGGAASLAASNSAVPTRWQASWRAVFQNVTVAAPSGGETTFSYSKGQPAEHFWQSGEALREEAVPSQTDPYLAQTQHFLQAVRGEVASLAPARHGLRGLRLVKAVQESARRGGAPVEISEE